MKLDNWVFSMSIYFLENFCYFSNMNNKLNFIFEVRKNSQAKTTTLLHFSASSLFGRFSTHPITFFTLPNLNNPTLTQPTTLLISN